jgi:hypothetical protein
MDQGVMERWGITSDEFDAAIAQHKTEVAIHAWLLTKTTPDRIRKANEWLETEKVENLDRQDSEEGVVV